MRFALRALLWSSCIPVSRRAKFEAEEMTLRVEKFSPPRTCLFAGGVRGRRGSPLDSNPVSGNFQHTEAKKHDRHCTAYQDSAPCRVHLCDLLAQLCALEDLTLSSYLAPDLTDVGSIDGAMWQVHGNVIRSTGESTARMGMAPEFPVICPKTGKCPYWVLGHVRLVSLNLSKSGGCGGDGAVHAHSVW